MIYELAPYFQKLTAKMLADIKKYVIKDQMDSKSIYLLLKHNYSENPIHKHDLYNTVYQFQYENNLEELFELQWVQLIEKYPIVAKYLQDTLYITKDSSNTNAKAIYAELLGLSKKAINLAIRVNIQQELSNTLKDFIHKTQDQINYQDNDQQNNHSTADINNPAIIKHRGRPSKRLKSNIKELLHKEK
ncbi:5444_t:CDS:2 [Cetraspora pellucida]|uniref:5444_t:CDS:1 n=1 Tax=Cetraspora pellucida TaxID=1433469 RepID=A0A9N9I632_9GLOM|nr:5444_t:CDS:2 [Cetraspora pellucida]